MNESNKKHLTTNTGLAKSLEAVQATNSDHPIEPPRLSAPAARRKRRLFASLIVLMAFSVTAIIVYHMRSALAYDGRYKGLVAALCAIAVGGFLIGHLIRVMTKEEEEEELQEEHANANQAIVSPPEPIPAKPQTNPTTPPRVAG
jgi:hypothetical protein